MDKRLVQILEDNLGDLMQPHSRDVLKVRDKERQALKIPHAKKFYEIVVEAARGMDWFKSIELLHKIEASDKAADFQNAYSGMIMRRGYQGSNRWIWKYSQRLRSKLMNVQGRKYFDHKTEQKRMRDKPLVRYPGSLYSYTMKEHRTVHYFKLKEEANEER